MRVTIRSPLRVGMLRVYPAVPAAETAANLHFGELEFCDFIPSFFRALLKLCSQCRGVAVRAGTAVEDENLF